MDLLIETMSLVQEIKAELAVLTNIVSNLERNVRGMRAAYIPRSSQVPEGAQARERSRSPRQMESPDARPELDHPYEDAVESVAETFQN